MGPEFEKGDGRLRPSSNIASPAQRGPRRDAQPLHATPLAAVLFPAPLRARALFLLNNKAVNTERPRLPLLLGSLLLLGPAARCTNSVHTE